MSMGSRSKNIFKYVAQHSGLSTQHGLCGCNSVVECKLPKLDVAGSSPVFRSKYFESVSIPVYNI